MNKSEAESLLRQMLGDDKSFRDGQWEAIHAAAVTKQRVMVVQRTGWGKSIVYFIATKILREAGAGPALLISPLLALMRNQIDAARLRSFIADGRLILLTPYRPTMASQSEQPWDETRSFTGRQISQS